MCIRVRLELYKVGYSLISSAKKSTADVKSAPTAASGTAVPVLSTGITLPMLTGTEVLPSRLNESAQFEQIVLRAETVSTFQELWTAVCTSTSIVSAPFVLSCRIDSIHP